MNRSHYPSHSEAANLGTSLLELDYLISTSLKWVVCCVGFVGSACKLLYFGLYGTHISITLIGAETPDTDNKGPLMEEGVSASVTQKPEMQTQIATSSPRALLSGKALAPAHQICISAAISPPATTVTGDSKCWGTDREAQQKWQNRERGSLGKRGGLKAWAYTCR